MAEAFALSVASIIGEELLKGITTIVYKQANQERKLVMGVEKEVEKLIRNLVSIEAVLDDAERRELKEIAVRNWLCKLKELYYDMEDLLDEWNTAIRKREMEDVEDASVNTTLSFLPSPCHCFGKVVHHRRDIALRIKEVSARLDEIVQDKARFGLELYRAPDALSRQTTASFSDASNIFGREGEKKFIKNKLLTGSGSEEIVSIVGMGGIGKTSLARLIYNDEEVEKHFEKKMWVFVSHPLDEKTVAKDALEALIDNTPSSETLQPLLQKISQEIEGKKFLLVLDDVWTENPQQWEPLKDSLKGGTPGSKILLTTRNYNVATMLGTVFGANHSITLEKLSNEVCWSIFSQLAFHGRSNEESERLEEIGKKIVQKCKGLPLAVKLLAGVMLFRRTKEEWESVLSSELWEIEEVERGLFPPLLLSYYDLPPEVRRCFLYFGMFPKNCDVERCNMIRMWMALGFLKETRSRTMDSVGEEYMSILLARSFVQKSARKIQMHDLVHDFARVLTRGECLILDENDPEESSTATSYDRVRHASLDVTSGRQFPAAVYKAKKLRSLFVISTLDGFFLIRHLDSRFGAALRDLFRQLRVLRSLSLSFYPIKEMPDEVGSLILLRHLDLAGCEMLKSLPETLGDLINLLSLDVSDCKSLEALPHSITKLTKLSQLAIMGSGLAFLPKGLGRLIALQKLDGFFVYVGSEYEDKAAQLGELKNLNLRGHLVIIRLGRMQDVSEVELAELENKKHLQALSLHCTEGFHGDEEMHGNEDAVLQALQPPSSLEQLEIIFHRGLSLPNWIVSLTQLTKLKLACLDNLEVLPPLGCLPNLEVLSLITLKKIRRLDAVFLGIENHNSNTARVIGFSKLKRLDISHMLELEEWDDGIERRSVGEKDTTSSIIMPQLLSLIVIECPKLTALPEYAVTASLLKLSIMNCPILDKRYKKEMGPDWYKISHVPEIKFLEF